MREDREGGGRGWGGGEGGGRVEGGRQRGKERVEANRSEREGEEGMLRGGKCVFIWLKHTHIEGVNEPVDTPMLVLLLS